MARQLLPSSSTWLQRSEVKHRTFCYLQRHAFRAEISILHVCRGAGQLEEAEGGRWKHTAAAVRRRVCA